jgi:hypothetical protein
MDAKQADLEDIKSRIAQFDQTKTIATKGHTKTTTVGDQGPARAALVHEREAAENALADLRIEKVKVDGERKAVEADLGPVRYLATLFGSTEQTMRYFILIVALLLDPAAVLLLLAATHRGRSLTPGRLPPVDKELMARAMTLAERSNWESDAATAASLREQAMDLYQQAHKTRRDAMYRRGR